MSSSATSSATMEMQKDIPPEVLTMFPSIKGQIVEILYDLDKSEFRSNTVFSITGTVKLHGTHADIVVESNSTIRFQSKNRSMVTPEDDNSGFAKYMTSLASEILALKAQYHKRYIALNPTDTIVATLPLIISGEWIGKGIQKTVAINSLERCFVITTVSINGSWIPNEDYAAIESPEYRIYNISRGGFYHETIDRSALEASVARLQAHTEAVDIECPFAKSFGVSGIGEGVVWTFDLDPSNTNLWLKTKGKHFTPTYEKKPREDKAKQLSEMEENVNCFVDKVAHGLRMRQGLDYLREMGKEVRMVNANAFAEWVVGDVVKEESREMAEEGLDEKLVKKGVKGAAFAWYRAMLAGQIQNV